MPRNREPVSLGKYVAVAGVLVLLITALMLPSPKETALVVGFVLLIGGLGFAHRH